MRSQLIRIQAEHLEGAGLIDDAISLLDKVVSDYPTTFDLAQVHHQIATCLEKKKDFVGALSHLRTALKIEKEHPNYLTGAWLSFGRLVVENQMRELYQETLDVIRQVEESKLGLQYRTTLPRDRYFLSSILAVLSADDGDTLKAQEHAKTALQAATLDHSGYRYHPKLGLVVEKNTPLYSSVQKLAK